MRTFYTFAIVLLGSYVMAIQNVEEKGELKRDKKDIAKLQALFGWNKSKQIPIVNLHEWKQPVYYSPPCNCGWRPTTRYAGDAVVVPSQPALLNQPQPVVIRSQPALASPPQPAYFIRSQPALLSPPQPSFIIRSQPALASPPQPSFVVPAEPLPPRDIQASQPALATPPEPCIHEGYNYDRPQTPLNS